MENQKNEFESISILTTIEILIFLLKEKKWDINIFKEKTKFRLNYINQTIINMQKKNIINKYFEIINEDILRTLKINKKVLWNEIEDIFYKNKKNILDSIRNKFIEGASIDQDLISFFEINNYLNIKNKKQKKEIINDFLINTGAGFLYKNPSSTEYFIFYKKMLPSHKIMMKNGTWLTKANYLNFINNEKYNETKYKDVFLHLLTSREIKDTKELSTEKLKKEAIWLFLIKLKIHSIDGIVMGNATDKIRKYRGWPFWSFRLTLGVKDGKSIQKIYKFLSLEENISIYQIYNELNNLINFKENKLQNEFWQYVKNNKNTIENFNEINKIKVKKTKKISNKKIIYNQDDVKIFELNEDDFTPKNISNTKKTKNKKSGRTAKETADSREKAKQTGKEAEGLVYNFIFQETKKLLKNIIDEDEELKKYIETSEDNDQQGCDYTIGLEGNKKFYEIKAVKSIQSPRFKLSEAQFKKALKYANQNKYFFLFVNIEESEVSLIESGKILKILNLIPASFNASISSEGNANLNKIKDFYYLF